MPREKTILIYKFDELPTEAAKERARNWWKGCRDSSDLENVVETFKELAGHLGITFDTRTVTLMNGNTRQDAKIFWELGYTQGDGASFDGSWDLSNVNLDLIRSDWTHPDKCDNSPANKAVYGLVATMEAIQSNLKEANIANAHIAFASSPRSLRMGPIDNPELLNAEGAEIVSALEDPSAEQLNAAHKIYHTFMENMQDFGRDLCTFLYDELRREDEYQTADTQVDETITSNEYEFLEDGTRAD